MIKVIVVTRNSSDEGVDVIGVVSTIEQAAELIAGHLDEDEDNPAVAIKDLEDEGYYPNDDFSYHIEYFDMVQ